MEQQDRIMDGDLRTLGLQSILKMLALSGKTGTLLVHSGPETLSISLRKGQIVALREEGVPQPDLLFMLCLVNRLDPPRAQAVREASGGNTQVALAMLVEHKWMSAAEMQQRLEFAITQSISHALRWVEGRFAFHRHLVPLENRMQALDIDSVLLEALRQADEWEEIGGEVATHLTRTAVARWLPEVHNDVRSLGLSQEYINGLLIHHGTYAKSLRGRGHVPFAEVVRYLEHRFAHQLQLLSKQQYPILETTEFANGKLDCTSILSLDKLVKGEQLEEFYWEAVLGLAAFLRMVFAELLRDEVGNSHTGRNLNVVCKSFLTEIDHEIQQYQVYRAYRSTQLAHGRDARQPAPISIMQNFVGGQGEPRNNVPGRGPLSEGQLNGLSSPGDPYGPPESRRRSMR